MLARSSILSKQFICSFKAVSTSAICREGVEKLDFPGGSIPLTSDLRFVEGKVDSNNKIPCYRTLDASGNELPDASVPHPMDEALAHRLYTCMAKLQVMDTLFYEAQRQGRFSFYMTSSGEEATIVASAAALELEDEIFAQYREQGALLWRGFSLQQFADQCYGNEREMGKGRQMPIHYGSRELHFQTISSPLATQLPHAVGAAYALKLQGEERVTAAYFGEGAASEGDFHAAVNFAAVLKAPTLFICRNNGYAISTPSTEQYAGDGIAARGKAYGVPAVRVDGGDARAVYNATKEARRIALEESSPVLLEAMMYRTGHHSTSDDSSRYRTAEEMSGWRARDPVIRFRTWMQQQGWWDERREQTVRREMRQEVVAALEAASKVPKPPLSALFTDVYSQMPKHLEEQMAATMDFVTRHKDICPPDIPVR